MPGKHTAKQKRQAKHIIESEKKRGKSPDEAKRIGWATVNAQKSAVLSIDEMHALVKSEKPPGFKPTKKVAVCKECGFKKCTCMQKGKKSVKKDMYMTSNPRPAPAPPPPPPPPPPPTHPGRVGGQRILPGELAKSNNTEEATMSNEVKYEELFKSETGGVEQPICNCPKCDAPILKSEVLAKAKGATTGNVSHDNKDGGHHKGPNSGPNGKTPVRSVHAQKTDKANPGAHAKSEGEDANDVEKGDDEVDVEKGAGSGLIARNPKAPKPKAPKMAGGGGDESVVKSTKPGDIIGGSRHVAWVQGDDEEIAKGIAEGRFGAAGIVRPPLNSGK